MANGDPTTTPVVTPPAAPAAEPEPGFLSKYAAHYGLDLENIKATAKAIAAHPLDAAKEIGDEAATEITGLVSNSPQVVLDTAKGVYSAIVNPEAQAKAIATLKTPGLLNKLQGAAEYATSLVPLEGGSAVESAEDFRKGNIRGGLGTLAGVVTDVGLGARGAAEGAIHEAGDTARANIEARRAASIEEAKTGKVITVEPQKALGEAPKQLAAAPAEADVPDHITFDQLKGQEVKAPAPAPTIEHEPIGRQGGIVKLMNGEEEVGRVRYTIPQEEHPAAGAITAAHIDDAYQGKGHGQAMYLRAAEELRAKGVPAMTSDLQGSTTFDAARVWDKLAAKGHPVEKVPSKAGSPGYKMDLAKEQEEPAPPEPQHEDTLARRGQLENQTVNMSPAYGDTGGYVGGLGPKQRLGEEDQLITNETQSQFREPYKIEVTNQDGTTHSKFIEGFSSKDAIKNARKEFPEGSEWRIESMPPDKSMRTPSTGYSVPIQKQLSIPPGGVTTPLESMHHEYGHVMLGQDAGLETRGMYRHTHSAIRGGNANAAVAWSGKDLYQPGRRDLVKPEKLQGVIRNLMGGPAADEVFNSRPRTDNHNMDVKLHGSDGHQSYKLLRAAGYDHAGALKYMNDEMDYGVAYLKRPGVASVVHENVGVREPGLSRQYHVSVERMKSMYAEAQRRIANEKPDDRAAIEGRPANDTANVPAGEGEVAPTTGGGAPETPPEKLKTSEVQKPADTMGAEDYGEERLNQMGKEAERRQNATEKLNNGTVGEQSIAGRQEDDIAGKGGGSQTPESSISKEKLTTSEVQKPADLAVAKLEKSKDENFRPIPYAPDKPFTVDTAPAMILPDGRVINANQSHVRIANAAGFDSEGTDAVAKFGKATGAVRVIYPLGGRGGNIGLELHTAPTDEQLSIAAHSVQKAAREGVGDGTVVWDLAKPGHGYQSGHGSLGDFQRAVDDWKKTLPDQSDLVSANRKKPGITPEEQSAQADYNREKQFAGEVLSGAKKVEDFEHYGGYQQTIDAESKLIPKGRTLFIGGGPIPLSSILLERAGFPVDTLELDPATTKLGEQVARKSGMKSGQFIAGDARTFDKFGDYKNIIVALEAGPTGESKTGVLQNIVNQAKPGTKVLARGTAGKGGEAFVDVNNALPKGVGVSKSVPTFDGYGQTHVLHSANWHETAGRAAATDEAGGIDPRTGKSDTTGIGTEIIPELRQPLDHAPTAEDFKKFHDQHQNLFDQYPELRIGWDNNSAVKGGHEINIGAVGPRAADVARKLDQKSAFDITKGENIPTGGTGLRTAFPDYPIERRIKDLNGEAPDTGSSVPLMKAPLTLEGTGENGRVTVLDFAKTMNEWSQQGLNPQDEIGVALGRARAELKYQLANDSSGLDWYKGDVKDAVNMLKDNGFPELENPTKGKLFRVLWGVTSYGVDPDVNTVSAAEAWKQYQKTGTIPKTSDGKAPWPGYGGIQGSITLLNKLLDEKGEQGTMDWLTSKHSVKDIRDQKLKTHATGNVPGRMADEKYGAFIFGPKAGAYVLNLQGIADHTTVDVWGARSMRRWTGTLTPESMDTPVTPAEARNFHGIVDTLGKELGLDNEDTQAVLWGYEHDLYKAHGVGESAKSYKGSVAKYVARDRAGETRSSIQEQSRLFSEGYGRAVEKAKGIGKSPKPPSSAGRAEKGNTKAMKAGIAGLATPTEDEGDTSFNFGANVK